MVDCRVNMVMESHNRIINYRLPTKDAKLVCKMTMTAVYFKVIREAQKRLKKASFYPRQLVIRKIIDRKKPFNLHAYFSVQLSLVKMLRITMEIALN